MKKIRITIDNLAGGGAEKVLINLLQKLNKKYEIDVFLINKSGVYLKEVPSNVYIDYNFKALFSNHFIERIKNSLEARVKDKIYSLDKSFFYNLNRKKYDYEIAFLEGSSTEIVANSKNKYSKKIAWVHIDLLKHRTMDIEKERKLYSKFDEIICVSNHSKVSLLKLYPEYEDRTKVIYNLIDEEQILTKSKEIIEMDKNQINIVTVGRLNYQKGYDLLLNAIKNLKNKNIKFKVYILGIGPEESSLKKYIIENSLQSYIEMVGFKRNPYNYIKESDIFISSSRYEGFSLVVAEAMLLNKPIIATDCTGPKEILNDGEYGVLVPVEDVKSLENAMENLILDKNKREIYSELSKRRKKIFNSEDVLKKIEELLDGK
ncbi:MAG: glycosyltransferase [Cetobacterium sp.]|uniref:glycosyltransferase n=1 Tax=Cetobacterium sp. TaxID=2071632 RepID=UPI003F2C87A7